jgi:tRNA(adenine34) deaminase
VIVDMSHEPPSLSPQIQAALMEAALAEARRGMDRGELPIGAVIAGITGAKADILGVAHNRNIETHRRISHAEMLALGSASDELVRRRQGQPIAAHDVPLDHGHIAMVSTLEPCIMCFSAAILSAVTWVVYALPSPADAGPARIAMVEKASARYPQLLGGVMRAHSYALFAEWAARNTPASRHWDFVAKLLANGKG